MGNDNSAMGISDNVPSRTLESCTVEGVAKYIKDKNVRRIVVMTGAGISTAAGIPDFRSPDTGLYANLERLKLPYPEAVFDISYFRKNPQPFYALAREMYPGRFRPTLAHSFIKLLYDKGRLLKLFTQNIDCLEREAGLPSEMIVEAHGSFATQSCIECAAAYPEELMRKAIEANDVPLCQECQGLVKPDIVFFGEALPESFFLNRTLAAAADLCIIMGTSLTVQPFAGLPELCRRETPRVMINLERAGGLGSRLDDVLLLGEANTGIMKLAEALGWKEELEALWAQTAPAGEVFKEAKEEVPQDRDELLKDEIERLTEEVDQALHISSSHEQAVRERLQEQKDKEEIEEEKESENSEPERDQEQEQECRSETTLEIPPKEEETTSSDAAAKLEVSNDGADAIKAEAEGKEKSTSSSSDDQKKPPSTL